MANDSVTAIAHLGGPEKRSRQARAGHRCWVTSSWDDGHHLDHKLAELLLKHAVRGTFYVPKTAKHRTASDSCVRQLASASFEVAAHGMRHVALPSLPLEAQRSELVDSKKYIEDLTGNVCTMFAYPFGNFNKTTEYITKATGYFGARTVKLFRNGQPINPFRLATTLHACRHFLNKTERSSRDPHDLRTAFRFERAVGSDEYQWLKLAKSSFDIIYAAGGVWHLWGHAWEVEQHGLWAELDQLLDYVMSHPDVSSVSNFGLLFGQVHGAASR